MCLHTAVLSECLGYHCSLRVNTRKGNAAGLVSGNFKSVLSSPECTGAAESLPNLTVGPWLIYEVASFLECQLYIIEAYILFSSPCVLGSYVNILNFKFFHVPPSFFPFSPIMD